MKKITKDFLEREYNHYKKLAGKSFEQNNNEKSLDYVEYCARIAQAYPIIKEFVDDDLESLLDNIAIKISTSDKPKYDYSNSNVNRIVFYNGQIIDSGALTEQYLDFFVSNSYKVLFIVPDLKSTIQGKNILETINQNPNISLFVPKSKSKIDKIKEINHEIDAFKPTQSFLHFLPSDVIGYCVFTLKNYFQRFYIVHNDHTFWLGKNCSDYFIEFRKFGHQLSVKRRGIKRDKILLVPYYPIISKTKFQSFPFDRTNKIVGFSGANLYKYLLDPELNYFNAIKYLIEKNQNFIFCLAGYGDTDLITKFITDNNLEERFFFLGRRMDFYSLVGNVDIFFESYPLKGGLSVLFAIEQNIPITGIANLKSFSQTSESFFDKEIDYVEPTNFDDFKNDANELISSVSKREKRVAQFQNLPNNRCEFQIRLAKIIDNDFDSLKRNFSGELFYDDDFALKECLSLPKTEITFLIRKLVLLKRVLSIKEIIALVCKIILHKEFKFPSRKKILNTLLRRI